ncbi:YCF48-related protein [Pseudomonas sp. FP597]|uniref:Glycosyl hydrolase n=1 Tax=Pseudomonas lactucae TaxID=2813360 RepID=A0A9X0YA44_9PSED|nr:MULTISPECIES: YCF48-related protein [Pseudomonas]MBN2975750.1 glycosyl hydrolase [Pseudomonas lactucae]MBN2985924.1 glycosyl hydrolase [Pseudomonas lactucae]WLI08868.1 YCF48-related protein [Pseudomonas sp. FP597]
MKALLRYSLCGLTAVGIGLQVACAVADESVGPLQPSPAAHSVQALRSPILAAAWAGSRVVAVGADGVVLLSDDQARSFRQADDVPVSSTLTGVSFVDAEHGWAVGHWGAVLATTDGGRRWQVQRLITEEDRPLFSVHFFDAQHGVAVGLWSLVLVTQDAGKTWVEQEANSELKDLADLNLTSLFADNSGSVYATAEQGRVLYSADKGNSWRYLNTGYAGSLWCGLSLDSQTLLVGGQRGTLLRSEDAGQTWTRINLDTTRSITSIASDGADVLLVGLDGLQRRSRDGGKTFFAVPNDVGDSLTVALPTPGDKWALFSRHGLVPGSE